MQSQKNGNKIYVILVICIGVVISVWLLERNPQNKALNAETKPVVSVNSYRNIAKNDDWKSILQNVDSKTDTSLIVSKYNDNSLEDSTLTDQMSRDFLSQYLLAVKNNGSVDSLEAELIARNTIFMNDSTKIKGVKYLPSNLIIDKQYTQNSLRIYRNKLYQIINKRISRIKDDPLMIVISSLEKEDEKKLSKLDPIIMENKGLLNDLLSISVPEKAVSLHLSLLNSSSKLIANLEAMRSTLSDPVKGFVGMGEYAQTMIDLNNSLKNFTAFFTDNL